MCGEIAPLIAPALQVPFELLPALQSLFVEEVFVEDIQASGRMQEARMLASFIFAREITGCPVDVHGRNRGELVEE